MPLKKAFCQSLLPIGAVSALLADSAVAQDLAVLAPLDAGETLGFYIDADSDAAGFRDQDVELCAWALSDWASNGGVELTFEPADEADAIIRVYFVSPQFGQYGEMRAIRVGRRRGAEVYIRPDTDALGPVVAEAARTDPLMREAVVYLTCLHELGHALGLVHTDVFEDIMYFFGFGGDIGAFFRRYRERLESRDDIRNVSGLSAGDIAQLGLLYPGD